MMKSLILLQGNLISLYDKLVLDHNKKNAIGDTDIDANADVRGSIINFLEGCLFEPK